MEQDNKVDLTKLNKKSKTTELYEKSKSLFKSKKRGAGPNRDNEGKFASGSGGLKLSKKLDLKRMLPVLLVVTLVGGLLVFRSFAATGDVTVQTNGKLLLLDTTSKRFPANPSNYTPNSYLVKPEDETGRVDFASSVSIANSAALPAVEGGNDKYNSVGDEINNDQFAFTKDGQNAVKIGKDYSSVPYKVKIYSYKIDGQAVKVLKESREWYSGGVDECFSGEGCINDLARVAVVGERIIYQTSIRPEKGSTTRLSRIYTMKLDGTDSKLLDVAGGDHQAIQSVYNYDGKIIYSSGDVYSINSDGSNKQKVQRTVIPVGKGYLSRHNGSAVVASPADGIEVGTYCISDPVNVYGMPPETECDDKASFRSNENLTHIVYDYKDSNKVLSMFTNNDLRNIAGLQFFVNDRINLLSGTWGGLKWSPDGKFMTANFISYARNPTTGALSNPTASVSMVFNPFEKKLIRKISSNHLEIYAWQPIPAAEEKRDPASCSLLVGPSSYQYKATWTSKNVPDGWTTRLYNSATNTTVPNLPLNGSKTVEPKADTLNTYSIYFNDPANPSSTVGCSAIVDLSTKPPQEKRSPTQ